MLYNKIYHLDFPIVNFPFIDKNFIAFAYGVYFILVYMIFEGFCFLSLFP